jgi:uncharacterized protein YegP (UPF0339 family)
MPSGDDDAGGRKRLLLLFAAVLGTLGALAVAVSRSGERVEDAPTDVGEPVEVSIAGDGETESGADRSAVGHGGDTASADESERKAGEDGEPGSEETDGEPDTGGEAENLLTVQCYEDGAGDYRWRLRHRNGRNLGRSTRGYATREDLDDALETLRERAPTADRLRFDPAAFELYEDGGTWRWRLRHWNGRTLGECPEGSESRDAAEAALDDALSALAEATADPEGESETEGPVTETVEEDGEWRWRLAADGETLAVSARGYDSRTGARQARSRFVEAAPTADRLARDDAVFEVYEDDGGRWRWRLVDGDGERTLAVSSRGYSGRGRATDAVERVQAHVERARVTFEDADENGEGEN